MATWDVAIGPGPILEGASVPGLIPGPYGNTPYDHDYGGRGLCLAFFQLWVLKHYYMIFN
jgi:hypothetical protein